MLMKPLVLMLVAMIALAVAGCERGAPSSEPAGALVGAISPADQALAEQIRTDLRCVYDGDAETAALRKFRNAVNNFDRNRARTQQILAELINQLYEDLAQDQLNSCSEGESVARVVARLIDDMSDFGDLPNVNEVAIREILVGGGSVKTFRLERGGGDVLPDGCIGYFVPAQNSNSGWVTVGLEEPANDPGFGSFPGKDTAPFWVIITSTFTGPFSPQVRVGWFLIDNQGEFSKNPSAEPPPTGADIDNCTIRNGNLVCGEDIQQTGGQLGRNLAIQCQTSGGEEFSFFEGAAWKVLEPLSPLWDADPLFANPGNTGLRSSFTSPFGSVFDEEEEVATTTDLQPTSAFLSDFQIQTFTATVSPNPAGGTVRFTIVSGTPSVIDVPVDTAGQATIDIECSTGTPSGSADAFVGSGSHTVDAEFLGSETHSGSNAPQATLYCSPYGPS